MWHQFIKNPVVRFLASLKLAVCVILSLVLLMTWGTLVESQHNAQFAKWQVYLSPAFIAVEILLFLNILFAALVRLPFRKRLTGFYITHLGLLTLLIGATLTAIYGIDGSLRLLPNQASNSVILNEPTLYAFYNATNSVEPVVFTEPLPQSVHPYSKPDKPYMQVLDYDLFLDEFLPFANARYSWKSHSDPQKKSRFLSLTLKNAMAEQSLDLSTFSDDQKTRKMGPLTLSLQTHVSHKCFEQALAAKHDYLFENNSNCVSFNKPDLNQKQMTLKDTIVQIEKSEPFLKLKITDAQNKSYIFYPQLSAHPVSDDIQIDDASDGYLMPMTQFAETPQVVFFRDDFLGYGKSDWQFENMELNKDITLPWMGFTMTLSKWIDNKYQQANWYYAPPSKTNENPHYAAKITLKHRYNPDDQTTLWVDDTGMVPLKTKSGFEFEFLAGRKLHHLPFSVMLTKFQMNTNPGTMDPASYESFVTVKEGDITSDAHIFMNNPMKRDKFTLYQASYFQINDTEFGSVLSVNHDPGRFLKYFGSILLVFGSILHFIIRARSNPIQSKNTSQMTDSAGLKPSRTANSAFNA